MAKPRSLIDLIDETRMQADATLSMVLAIRKKLVAIRILAAKQVDSR